MVRTGVRSAAAMLALMSAATLCRAAERSFPLDCLPDRVVSWEAVADDPLQLFGAAFLPGVVLGPPGDSVPYQGSLSVASLGFGGSVVLAFDDVVVEDRPGPDFIIYENAFFKLPVPATEEDTYRLFVEPAIVEVSSDGEQWLAFPHSARALDQAAAPDIGRELFLQLTGLAGVTPTFSGNWTRPDDRAVFDPAGQGGVSGAGGDAFDLATLGLAEARFVRITDAATLNGLAGPGEGFDLDAVVALHARPAALPVSDEDGDGLSDAEETQLYGTRPDLADSDGDGVDDGREVAACRDPNSFDEAPWTWHEPRLWLLGSGCTELRWSFTGSGRLYDLVRGDVGAWTETPVAVDLGPTVCLAAEQTSLRWACDPALPEPSEGFFYLVRDRDAADFGRTSSLNPREAIELCP